ncbi:Cytochrome b-c1 complex subunit 7 [Pyricularia oryzae]|uniref:Cytochrome b-c1 complex subunit 7 n=5 Tax=Pyricularia TaxID=48558 RepID=Q5EMZ8_PYRGI|nr:cytochrome b-c1 complex subunit 7 [Pyricularia oryzae 70-15]AAX07655.1 ubiquinol-cytochrome C reductase-like protein [Pyricularia grisea]ADD84612.1 ubiquinol-cytochrome C reductase [Pyricularia oryzae]ELQ42869.1 cytochrome b-c1 complex subunit 7 [Pyricularia oryzae Y34]EHA52270.1 cytochrome b-c1 complex subunit 7 [Pyricularia oryzae 70-15]KAH8847522.1 Cytochrome b-c1 complex subunit 7 [Pyricularia oryzae]
MSYPSAAPFILRRPWLKKLLMPVAEWHANAAGYRQMGLRADDLIPEESETVQAAIKRLDAKENYDRIFRLRRAAQLSLSHQLLPKSEWTKPEQDVPYLLPIIKRVEAELAEKAALDSAEVLPKGAH